MDAAAPVFSTAKKCNHHSGDGACEGGSIFVTELAADAPSDGDGKTGEEDQEKRSLTGMVTWRPHKIIYIDLLNTIQASNRETRESRLELFDWAER